MTSKANRSKASGGYNGAPAVGGYDTTGATMSAGEAILNAGKGLSGAEIGSANDAAGNPALSTGSAAGTDAQAYLNSLGKTSEPESGHSIMGNVNR